MKEKPSKREELLRLKNHRSKIWNKYYLYWRDNPVFCPALNKTVLATKSGWEHIAGFSKSRSIDDTHRRLDLFKYARNILEKSGTIQYIRHQNGQIHYCFEAIVEFKGEYERGRRYKRVKVVLVERANGNIVFHSVMN